MNEDSSSKLSFESPPIAEVALSVQFEPLARLHAVHLGLLWERFRDQFPGTEEQPPLPHVIEQFGGLVPTDAGLQIEFTGVPTIPRCWFLDSSGTELIQVQQDRLVVNWRRGDADEPYPQFSHVRQLFAETLDTFLAFLKENQLGALKPDQCEITYIDHIEQTGVWERHGQLDRVLSFWKQMESDDLLPELEAAVIRMRFIIPGTDHTPLGRLYVDVQPGFRRTDRKPIFVMNSVARGRPEGEDRDDILAFFDAAHEWVRRGFLGLTSPEMQRVWRRQDG